MSGWFGESWGAAVCVPESHYPTPVGAECARCDELVEEGDRGIVTPYVGIALTIGDDGIGHLVDGTPVLVHHLECFLRGTVGGVNHLLGRCHCCGGTEDPDPPGMTKREAAKAAVDLFWRQAASDPEQN